MYIKPQPVLSSVLLTVGLNILAEPCANMLKRLPLSHGISRSVNVRMYLGDANSVDMINGYTVKPNRHCHILACVWDL